MEISTSENVQHLRMRQRFETIYETNQWRYGSGEGSLVEHTRGYVRFLENFLRKHEVKSVVDLGCGDWQFSRRVDWGGAKYTGFDIVRGVVESNSKNFARSGVRFEAWDGLLDSLPEAGLLIAKDVLQHWSSRAVSAFLPVLGRYPLALITNCCNPSGPTANADIEDGEFRYLDIREAPFSVPAREVYSFTNHRSLLERFTEAPRWLKRVLLVERQRG